MQEVQENRKGNTEEERKYLLEHVIHWFTKVNNQSFL